ncbi:MAG: hypothetical protein KDB22_01525 [Planctomycetales bacterium]|nr:hypothetical protein [Planctomycetales bacterium]
MNNPQAESTPRAPRAEGVYSRPQAKTIVLHRQHRRPRIAFYSHDTMGMGHLRRNMLIASTLSAGRCRADTLLIAGTREAGFFAEQAGMDCVTLPALTKNMHGRYAARHYSWSVEETARLRGRIIASTLLAFRPDVLIVDKVPQGICNELLRALKLIRKRQSTHCVLGLRDVLDNPSVVSDEWKSTNADVIIEHYFDEVWVYGDPRIYDCRNEYGFSAATVARIRFTGYLDQTTRIARLGSRLNASPLVLCVVGGGQDGIGLAKAFVGGGVPEGWQGVVITGPFMPAEEKQWLTQLANQHSKNVGQITVIDRLVESDEYLSRADRVVAMGGYNTIMSILSFGKPALVVPRTNPRSEQWIRATQLAELGMLSTLHPNELTAESICAWVTQAEVPAPVPEMIDLRGLDFVQARVAEITNHCSVT